MQQATTISIARRLLDDTSRALRDAGKQGYELFALWTGTIDDATFNVGNLHVPRQRSYKTSDGLCVMVDGEELHRLNVWLFDNKQIVGVQLHAHPLNAYHSETDDTFPIATLLGAYSLVVPDFARHGVLDQRTQVYRRNATGWEHQDTPISKLIELY